MPKTAREIIAMLTKKGWRIKSQRGSHIKLIKIKKIIILPDHGSKTLGKGLIKSIEKQSGVKLL